MSTATAFDFLATFKKTPKSEPKTYGIVVKLPKDPGEHLDTAALARSNVREQIHTDAFSVLATAPNTMTLGPKDVLKDWSNAKYEAMKSAGEGYTRIAWLASYAALRELEVSLRFGGACVLAHAMDPVDHRFPKPIGFLGYFEGVEIWASSLIPEGESYFLTFGPSIGERRGPGPLAFHTTRGLVLRGVQAKLLQVGDFDVVEEEELVVDGVPCVEAKAEVSLWLDDPSKVVRCKVRGSTIP